jgi:hypothetical protein
MNDVTTSQKWAGRILSGIAVLFLLFDGVTKLMHVSAVVKGTTELGYPESSVTVIGVIVLACTLLHVIPRTAVLGAVLLTGFLGGAVASQVRVGNPLFSHELFPVYIAVLVWLGLWLRNPRFRRVVAMAFAPGARNGVAGH